jgi:hypothetical protein
MKTLIITIFSLLAFVPCFSKPNISAPKHADEYFLTYRSDESWLTQRHWLDNLAWHLSKFPENNAHIGFTLGKNESLKKAKARMSRSVKYLTQYYKIEKSRIVVFYLEKDDEAYGKIILQPVTKDQPSPFSQEYYKDSKILKI